MSPWQESLLSSLVEPREVVAPGDRAAGFHGCRDDPGPAVSCSEFRPRLVPSGQRTEPARLWKSRVTFEFPDSTEFAPKASDCRAPPNRAIVAHEPFLKPRRPRPENMRRKPGNRSTSLRRSASADETARSSRKVLLRGADDRRGGDGPAVERKRRKRRNSHGKVFRTQGAAVPSPRKSRRKRGSVVRPSTRDEQAAPLRSHRPPAGAASIRRSCKACGGCPTDGQECRPRRHGTPRWNQATRTGTFRPQRPRSPATESSTIRSFRRTACETALRKPGFPSLRCRETLRA